MQCYLSSSFSYFIVVVSTLLYVILISFFFNLFSSSRWELGANFDAAVSDGICSTRVEITALLLIKGRDTLTLTGNKATEMRRTFASLCFIICASLFLVANVESKKSKKCPLHAKKVQDAIDKLNSNEECSFVSVLGNITPEDARELAKALESNKVVETFFFGPRSQFTPESFKEVLNGINKNTGIVTLGVWNEGLSNEMISHLAGMLKTNDKIDSLSIENGHKVTEAGLKTFAKAMQENTNMKTLSIKVGKASDESISPLFHSIARPESKLRMLTFHTVSEVASERYGDVGAVVLANALKRTKELLVLNLEHSNIGNIGGTAIFQALTNNTSVNHINIYNSSIGDATAHAVGEYLKTNTKLLDLMLDHSKITDKGAKLIGQGLSTNQRLRTLSIVNTPISDLGALAIVNGMKDNTALTDVHLRRTGRNVREFWREKQLPKIENDTLAALDSILVRNKEWQPLLNRLLNLEDKVDESLANDGNQQAIEVGADGDQQKSLETRL